MGNKQLGDATDPSPEKPQLRTTRIGRGTIQAIDLATSDGAGGLHP